VEIEGGSQRIYPYIDRGNLEIDDHGRFAFNKEEKEVKGPKPFRSPLHPPDVRGKHDAGNKTFSKGKKEVSEGGEYPLVVTYPIFLKGKGLTNLHSWGGTIEKEKKRKRRER